MKLILSLFILTLTNYCSAQSFDLVKGEHEEYYVFSVSDSFDINVEYPNGRYKIFSSDSLPRPMFVFYLSENMVNGPYLEFKKGGYTYGNYYNDSTWSFLNAPNDTTFKVGTWRFISSSLGYSTDEIYQVPFDTDGLFTETWYFPNGQLARKAIHQKADGIIKETYWDYDTGEVSRHSVNARNHSHEFRYSHDTLDFVALKSTGIELQIDYDCRFCSDSSIVINAYSGDDLSSPPITTLTLDYSTTGRIQFRDLKKQVFMNSNKDGNILVQYKTKRGKVKFKTLKIN